MKNTKEEIMICKQKQKQKIGQNHKKNSEKWRKGK